MPLMDLDGVVRRAGVSETNDVCLVQSRTAKFPRTSASKLLSLFYFFLLSAIIALIGAASLNRMRHAAAAFCFCAVVWHLRMELDTFHELSNQRRGTSNRRCKILNRRQNLEVAAGD
jgi:hypothetical protein